VKKLATNSLESKDGSSPESDESGRLFIIDGGTTDNIGIDEFFIYFGAASLAIVCFLAFIGIILGLLDQIQATPTPTTYGAAATTDSYS